MTHAFSNVSVVRVYKDAFGDSAFDRYTVFVAYGTDDQRAFHDNARHLLKEEAEAYLATLRKTGRMPK